MPPPIVRAGIRRLRDATDLAAPLTPGSFIRRNLADTGFELAAVSSASGADPTSLVGLSAANGSASTFMRSDGAPALSQAIVPTWTGLHTFQAQTSAKAAVFKAAATTPDNIVEFQTSGGSPVGSITPTGEGVLSQLSVGIAPVGPYYAANIKIAFTDTVADSAVGIGSYFYNNRSTDITDVDGIYSYVDSHGTSGVVSSISALYTLVFAKNADNVYGIYIDGNIPSAGTITNNYGLYVAEQLGVGANNYAMYTEGGTVQHNTGVATAIGCIIRGFTSQSSTLVQLQGQSSTTAREMADIDTAWATATDASRKARLLFRVWDTSVREGLRIESDGTNALCGFGGSVVTALTTATFQAPTSGIAATFKAAATTPGNIVEWQNSIAVALAKITHVGGLVLPTGDTIGISPTTIPQWSILSTTDQAITIGRAGSGVVLQLGYNAAGAMLNFAVGSVTPDNNAGAVRSVNGPLYLNDSVSQIVVVGSTATPSGKLTVVPSTAAQIGLSVTGITSQTATLVQLQGQSSTTAGRQQADIDTAWNVSTDASRSADLILRAWYTTTAREGLRIRGGSADVQLGFYGAPPISQAILATGVGATVDNVITALQNLGLVKQS